VTLNWGSAQVEAYRLIEDEKESGIEDSCWLVVESALTIAYIWRLGCHGGVVEVVHRLLRDGIPFYWLYPRSATYYIERPPNRDSWHTGLEWQPHGWRASPEEYLAYEQYQDTYVAWNGYCISALVRGSLL
jgi:hypothetical protein